MAITIHLADAAATEAFGHRLSQHLMPGDCLLLDGPLGAGKTALARAVIQSLQQEGRAAEDVPSPTYTLVQTYETARGPLWHADLFRLSDPDEIPELGLSDAFDEAITLIEWPDRLGPYQPARHLRAELAIAPADSRTITLLPHGPRWDWITALVS